MKINEKGAVSIYGIPPSQDADNALTAITAHGTSRLRNLIGWKRGVVHARLLASVLAASQTSASNAGTMLCAGH
jgi:hypothetical protein